MREYIDTKGRRWKRFSLSWTGPDGPFGVRIWALSHEHALLVVEDMKATLQVEGESTKVLEYPDKEK